MGIMPNYNESNPPPFHLNVNNPIAYGYPLNNDIGYNKNSIYQPKINKKNNKENSKVFEEHKKNKEKKNKNKKEDDNLKGNLTLEKKKQEIPNENSKSNDFSIDINILTKDKVEVKIPIKFGKNKNKIWKKEFNKKELIGTVINDYLIENELKLPKDYFSELKCFNKTVKFQDEISSLLPKEIENEKQEERKKEEEEVKYPEIIGKPFYDPFQILCFYKNQKKFVTLNYNKDIKEEVNIENFDKTSAYCNGYNHLYISGGEKSLNNFWDINLKKNKINPPIKDMPPKKYHSMIFVPEKKVFIVGGNSLSTFYYNLKEKKIIKWGRLNIIRMEPALQFTNNKLYCFDCTNLKKIENDYSFEFTDLNSEPKWEFIKPKINFNLNFNQQLFGLAKDKNNNIIFIGGIFDDKYNNMKNKNIMNFMFDVNKNEIILSDVKHKKFNLKERGFFPFNKTYDCILTDFDRSSPQICFFYKKKLKIELINFSSEIDSKISLKNNKDDNISNITPVFSLKKNLYENNTNIGLRNPNLIQKYNTINEEKKNINHSATKTMNIIGNNPEKNTYRIKKLNDQQTNNNTNERNNSYDSRKFYYPKNGLKTNKNLYNYYKTKNY